MKMRRAIFVVFAVLASAWVGTAHCLALGAMTLTSPDFPEGSNIPSRFTCDGADVSPSLHISKVPAGTKSLVLIVDDPDAPTGTWTHWLMWNIPPETSGIASSIGVPGAVQGMNDFSKSGYGGPCPPSGTHRYFFRLYALDTMIYLPASSNRKALDQALHDHVIARAEYMGRYSRLR